MPEKDQKDPHEHAAEIEKVLREHDAKKDADEKTGTELDKVLAHMVDSIGSVADAVKGLHKRMDAIEEVGSSRRDKKRDDDGAGRKDAKRDAFHEQPAQTDDDDDDARRPVAADKKRDDDDAGDDWDSLSESERERRVEEEAGRSKPGEPRELVADAARKRYDDMRKRETRYDRQRRHDGLRADAQARADEIYTFLGMSAPKPMAGETPKNYRLRLLRQIQRHSSAYRDVDLRNIADPKVLRIAEETIYADGRAEGLRPTDVGFGQLRMKETKRDGHTVREFYGSPDSWMGPMAGPVRQYVTKIFTPRDD